MCILRTVYKDSKKCISKGGMAFYPKCEGLISVKNLRAFGDRASFI